MSTSYQIVLILGSGPRTGDKIASAFSAKGYKVAVTSRKARENYNSDNNLSIASDLTDPSSVAHVFSEVKAKWGNPNVVIYNAGAATFADKKNPLSIPIEDITNNLNVNTISPFAAATHAVQGFEELPEAVLKTFIFTGNCLNEDIIPALIDAGMGKSATAHMIKAAASVYADRGFTFYYADERNADGSPVYFEIDGDAHGKLFTELAEKKEQGPWQQTFVKGEGYKKF